MKVYNHSLDFTVLALASAADGDYATAGKLLVKASKAHDVGSAVAILEASNAQAFERLTASKKAKPAGKVAAGARVKAATKVRAFDIGDEDEINELIEDDVEVDEEEVETDEEVDAAEEDEDEGFDTAFASMLKGMKGASKRK